VSIPIWINDNANRPDILRARRACNKAIKLSGPLVGGAAEIYAVLQRLGIALKALPKTVNVDRRPGIPALIKKADDIYSVYVRLKYVNEYGNCQCVTCGKWGRWQDADNGHFIGRQFKVLRYNDKNCHPQCRECNRFNEGRKDLYEKFIIKTYGENVLLWLKANKKDRKYARYELEALIKYYGAGVDGLKWAGK
jgi:hypothetical protein